jgi:HTH-type transcriptional regulator/antitoxin HigA
MIVLTPPKSNGEKMNIKPIKTEKEYEAALEEIERLFDADPDTPSGDRLEVLVTLVEAYEDIYYPIPLPDPIEAILYYMESRSLTRADLEKYIGSRARVSEILNRKRPLTLSMIQRLHEGLGIPAEVLVQPYELAATNSKSPRRQRMPVAA